MGKTTFSRDTYFRAASAATDGGTRSATAHSEQQARVTGKLNPLVDPAEFGVIRRSLPRLEKRDDGLFEMTVGPPINVESQLDTTSSMQDSIDLALKSLADTYDGLNAVMPRYDIQMATGLFNDVGDTFVLCRPQFEMEADKLVHQLSLLVPERGGGDPPEDPQYGLFGAAYLTDAHVVKYGLKGYHFTISDAPGRNRIDKDQLIRIFGKEVFEKVAENGFQVSPKDIPSTKEVVQELLTRSHAFFLQVRGHDEATRFWQGVFPAERVIQLPSASMLSQVQAAIVGLTEGTLDLGNCKEFLLGRQVPKTHADTIVRSLAGIPLGAQAELPNFSKLPKAGDLFTAKTDVWPIDAAEKPAEKKSKGGGKKDGKGPEWL